MTISKTKVPIFELCYVRSRYMPKLRKTSLYAFLTIVFQKGGNKNVVGALGF
ncbi:hypothetical protein RHGRI_001052 [Rhododendron griersonianum]|uniref:Uncharacterized protein n=1 Tax=Rhododendron griersonianum TaxID=479676 RepID=A0AAV6LK06_9ERIC|nr:hypothetical protein RHGRI_001052 [Rhododendron griersonianum]